MRVPEVENAACQHTDAELADAEKPKGRAMKREKYTRRFVNVQLTGGKRKVREELHVLQAPA